MAPNPQPPPFENFASFRAHLIPQLTAKGPDAPEVAALVAQGKQQFPDRADQIDGIVAAWRDAPATAGPTATTPKTAAAGIGVSSLLVPGGTLTAGAVATALFAYREQIAQGFDQLHLVVTSTWILLAVIAAVGAVGGLVNSYFAQSGLILPRVQRTDGKLTVFPGFLGNLVTGAGAAIVAVWLATPATPAAAATTTMPPADATPSATTAAPIPADGPKNLLSASMLLSAFVAGFGGSRLATGARDKQLLWSALETALGQDADPVAARAVSVARSAQEAFVKVTGNPVPGVTAAADHPDDVNTGLRALFDAAVLKDYLNTRLLTSQPAVTRDGAGLPLRVLNAAQKLPDPLRMAVMDLPLIDVAGKTKEAFIGSVTPPAGVEPAAVTQGLSAVWDAAREVKTRLAQMPAAWRLEAATTSAGA